MRRLIKGILSLFLFVSSGFVLGLPTCRADSPYQMEAVWGETGSGPGQFQEPMGIDVDKEGFVYVADSRNRRVQKFDPHGKFLSQFGEPGDGLGRFEKPVDVAVGPGGTIYVSDYDLDRVQAFSPAGRYLFGWGESGESPGRFRAPAGLAVDARGQVYVADFYNSRIQVFDAHGKWIRTIGRKGHGRGNLNDPTDIAVGQNGDLFVADAYNHRIQKFDPQGKVLEVYSGDFRVPSGIAVDGEGLIHVADSAHKRVVLLDRKGNEQGRWKLAGDRHPNVYSPTRLAVAPNGRVFAVDTSNDRLLVLIRSRGLAPAQGGLAGQIVVHIEGLACPFCAYGVEKELKKLPGVREAHVNLGEGTAVLPLRPGEKVSDESIRQAVKRAGFKASEVKAVEESRP